MAAGLCFGRASACKVWADDGIALARVGVSSGAWQPDEPIIHRRGPFRVAADLRVPGANEDAAAHDDVFHSLEAETFPKPIDGDFALAVWDSRVDELRLARDRIGIRPLFFVQSADGDFAFASFPEALIAGGLVEGRYNQEALAEIALARAPGGERSWIEGIHRVPPGHYLSLRAGTRRLIRYWRYPVGRTGEATSDHAEAARRLRAGVETAMARAMPPRAPVFTLLSGGLDSGSITALASQVDGFTAADVTACCMAVPASHKALGAIDETRTARQVAQHVGVRLVELPTNRVRDLLLGPLGRTFVESMSPEDAMPTALRHAAESGTDRVLCGYGGDEAVSFNGKGALLADFLTLRWLTLWRTAHELSTPAWRALLNQAAAELLPPRLDHWLRSATGQDSALARLWERAVQRRARPPLGWQPRLSIGPKRTQRRRLESGTLVHRLEKQAWQAAQQGMRFVFPMLDWRLLEIVSSIPGRLQLQAGKRRALMRTAMADLLPKEIVDRTNKLDAAPTTLYQLALDRDALIAELRRAARSPAAMAVVDLGEIERQIASIPEPDEVAEEIRANAAAGRQFRDPRTGLLLAFSVARALAQNEDHCLGQHGLESAAA